MYESFMNNEHESNELNEYFYAERLDNKYSYCAQQNYSFNSFDSWSKYYINIY